MLSAASVLEATAQQEHESKLASLERQIEMRLEALSSHKQFLRKGFQPAHTHTRAHTHIWQPQSL